MQIFTNHSLKKYNTFGIDVNAKYFVECSDIEDLKNLLATPVIKNNPILILGGGSNVLFTKKFEGVVIKIGILGIKTYMEDNLFYFVKCGAGVTWHEFVLYCTERNYGGVENLALIPGTMGAAPIQNIGAYGTEIKDYFYELKAIEIETGTIKIFKKEDCKFGYRDSIFKKDLKNQYVVLEVTLKLEKNPKYNIQYGAIAKELEAQQLEPSVKNIRETVIKIRKSKLPDPKVIGNAGSFFKNPTVSQATLDVLLQKFPALIYFKVEDGFVKISAGWLIEYCGWKGYKAENYGVYEKQALVIVNHGEALGEDIYQLSEKILQSVKEKFDITLEREVNVIG